MFREMKEIKCLINVPKKSNKLLIFEKCTISFYSNQVIEDHELNGRAKKRSTSSRPHSDLVKWQGTPIRSPLLRLPMELSPLAIECFECILRYCGDLAPDPELTEVKCVYTILMVIFVFILRIN